MHAYLRLKQFEAVKRSYRAEQGWAQNWVNPWIHIYQK